MAGKNSKIPWFENLTEAEFNEWSQDDPESFQLYLKKKTNEYEKIKSELEQGEPHPLEFEDGAEDPRYLSRMRIFEREVADDRAEAKRQAAKSPHAPVPRELRALMEGGPEEKARAVEVSKLKTEANELLKRAEEHRLAGKSGKAEDLKELAGYYMRDIARKEKPKYGFEIQQEQNAVKYAEEELTEAMGWTSEQVKKNRAHLEGLIQGHRDMSETEYSFVVDDKDGKVLKLNHPGVPSSQIAARIGTTQADVLIRKLGVHGIEGREEEPEPKKEKKLSPMNQMTEGEFEKYQKEAQESRKPNTSGIEVAKGFFPPQQ